MKTIIVSLLLTTVALPALATQPPKPDPAPTQVQGQTQGQAQGQVQGQGQIQGQSSYNKNTNNNANLNANSNRNSNKNTANGGAGGNASSNSSAGSTSRGGDQGQSQSVDNSGAGSNSNNYQQSGIPVSSAVAPSFAIGGCQWAISGGIQFFGTGVSGGGAGMYEFCKGLMKAKHFREVGNVGVATALECQDSSIRAAYKEAGQPCAADMPRQVAQAPTQTAVPVLAAAPRSPCPSGIANEVKQRDGSTQITCN